MKSAPRRRVLMLVVLVAGLAHAEVRETTDSAFVIESSVSTAASPAAVYAALGKVSAWWDPNTAGPARHGRVVFAQPGKLLRLDTALGPLQEMAVTGVLTFKLTPEASGTRITMNYRVAGAFTMQAAKLAPLVDQVMDGQLERLRAHLNTGKAGK
jgi:hypothetical protein